MVPRTARMARMAMPIWPGVPLEERTQTEPKLAIPVAVIMRVFHQMRRPPVGMLSPRSVREFMRRRKVK